MSETDLGHDFGLVYNKYEYATMVLESNIWD